MSFKTSAPLKSEELTKIQALVKEANDKMIISKAFELLGYGVRDSHSSTITFYSKERGPYVEDSSGGFVIEWLSNDEITISSQKKFVFVSSVHNSERCIDRYIPGKWTDDMDEVLTKIRLADFGLTRDNSGAAPTSASV